MWRSWLLGLPKQSVMDELGFKLRSPAAGLVPWYLWKFLILSLSCFRKGRLGGGKNSCVSLIKDEFLAPHCDRKQGTNPLVLTGNKENVAKIL